MVSRVRSHSEALGHWHLGTIQSRGASMNRHDHKPARMCPLCGGPCLVVATIDEANLALSVAMTYKERMRACMALIHAAQVEHARMVKLEAEKQARAPIPAITVPLSTVDYVRVLQRVNGKGRTP